MTDPPSDGFADLGVYAVGIQESGARESEYTTISDRYSSTRIGEVAIPLQNQGVGVGDDSIGALPQCPVLHTFAARFERCPNAAV